MTPSRSEHTIVASTSEQKARHLRVAAWALTRAVERASLSATIQEGLCDAYKRDLCWLPDLAYVPVDMRLAIHKVVSELRSSLGFDHISGEKRAPSRLSCREARSILVALRKIRARAASIAPPT